MKWTQSMDHGLLECKRVGEQGKVRGKWAVIERLWKEKFPESKLTLRQLQGRCYTLEKTRKDHLPRTEASGANEAVKGHSTQQGNLAVERRENLPPYVNLSSTRETEGRAETTQGATPEQEGGRALGTAPAAGREASAATLAGRETSTERVSRGPALNESGQSSLRKERTSDESKPDFDKEEASPEEVAWRKKLTEEFATVHRETKGLEGDFACRKERPGITGGRVNHRAVKLVNELIAKSLDEDSSAWNLNCLVYAGAVVVQRRSRRGIQMGTGKTQRLSEREVEIRTLRRRIGWLYEEVKRWETSRNPKPRATKLTRKLRRVYGRKADNLRELRVLLTEVKGLLQVRKTQARELRERLKFENLQNDFEMKGPKCLEGRNPRTDTKERKTPTGAEISEFWGGLLGVEGECDLDNPAFTRWVRQTEETVQNRETNWSTVDDVWEQALKKAKNWRAPGPDKIKVGWWKLFNAASDGLRKFIKGVLRQSRKVPDIPQWFVTGRTVMIPKDGCEGKPDQYRPIACLNTSYKLLTSVMSKQLMAHVEENEILPEEQLALRKGRRGCTDALLIDHMISDNAWARNAGLSVAWIDFKKAYDRVPFAVIIEVLRASGVPQTYLEVLGMLMGKWESVFEVKSGKKTVKVNIEYKRGLLQGDALSPLVFCLCIAPVSEAIRHMEFGYKPLVGAQITHSFFMDDLKIYCHAKAKLAKVLERTRETARAVGMELGLTKCAEAHKRTRGRVEGELLATTDFRRATGESPYTYLGVKQVLSSSSKGIIEPLRKEYLRRVQKIWSSNLSGKNKVRAHNVWAVSLFRYYFGNLDWTWSQLNPLDTATRKVLRRNKSHHVTASVARLYLPRDAGGRGLHSVKHVYEREKVSVAKYVMDSDVPRLIQVRENWEALRERKASATPLRKANTVLSRYGMPHLDTPECGDAGSIGKMLKVKQFDQLVDELQDRVLHRSHFNTQSKADYDQDMSRLWLSDGRLRSVTEGLVCALQDGVVWTRAYRKGVLKHETTDRCRMCNKAKETIGHLMSSCEKLTWTLYKSRHDRVLFQVVRSLASAFNLSIPNHLIWTTTGWTGVGVLENEKVKLTIDVSNPTIAVMTERRPDLIVYLKEAKRILVMEIACAWDPLLEARENEKRDKYLTFASDLCRQLDGWEAQVYPLVFGDLGSIRGLREELTKTKLLDSKSIVKLIRDAQRETLCSAVRIIRTVLANRD